MNDNDTIDISTFRKNDRLIKALEKRLDDVEKKGRIVGHNYKYVLEYSLEAPTGIDAAITAAPLLQTKTFVTNKNALWVCKSIEAVVYFIGTLNTYPARAAVLPSLCSNILRYRVDIRDSGTQGNWSNKPIPGNYFRTEKTAGLTFARGRTLAGGTEVSVDTIIDYFDPSFEDSGFSDITGASVQLIFSGVEYAIG